MSETKGLKEVMSFHLFERDKEGLEKLIMYCLTKRGRSMSRSQMIQRLIEIGLDHKEEL